MVLVFFRDSPNLNTAAHIYNMQTWFGQTVLRPKHRLDLLDT